MRRTFSLRPVHAHGPLRRRGRSAACGPARRARWRLRPSEPPTWCGAVSWPDGPEPSSLPRLQTEAERGYEVEPAPSAPFLEAAVDEGPLLPPSLGKARVGNERLALLVLDPFRQEILRRGAGWSGALRVSVSGGDAYAGALEGFTAEVEIDPVRGPRPRHRRAARLPPAAGHSPPGPGRGSVRRHRRAASPPAGARAPPRGVRGQRLPRAAHAPHPDPHVRRDAAARPRALGWRAAAVARDHRPRGPAAQPPGREPPAVLAIGTEAPAATPTPRSSAPWWPRPWSRSAPSLRPRMRESAPRWPSGSALAWTPTPGARSCSTSSTTP